MKLNDLVNEAHSMAKDKGWWTTPREDGTLLMLMVCELAEAAEEARKNTPDVYLDGNKPEGKAIELVDTVIRIADYFGHKGWDLEELVKLKLEYNKTRSNRHGGKAF